MALIEVSEELAQLYDDLARSSGQDRDALIRETLIEHLEEVEDIAAARERLANPGRRISLSEVERNLGLAD